MSYNLRKQFDTALATTFLNDIQYQRNNYYYFLGKLEPWGADDRPLDVVQDESYAEDVLIRNNAAYFKKITPNDVTLVCPRYNWTSGTVYAQWDDTQDMEAQAFYVITDENQVYKCLNNSNGAVSTVKPRFKPLAAFKTSDGYTWKYMYSVPSFKQARFTSLSYIPVQKALTESFYDQGSVESVSITSAGSGYTDAQQTYIVVSGSTSGSGAAAIFNRNASGAITFVNITSAGSGYTAGVKVRVVSATGQGAVLQPVIVAGAVTGVTVVNGGFGYLATDTIQFSVGGAILVPKISRVTGEFIDVIVVDGGIGYTSAPTLTIGLNTPANVDGKYGNNTTALLEAIIDQGSIQAVLIRDPGVNYPAATDTSITIQGDGIGLQLSPVVYAGEIVDVIVENPGYGYTNLILTVNGSGAGSVLRPIISSTDITSDQTIIEQVSIDGAIYAVVMTETGTGYTNTTQVTITGDGDGATAHAIVVDGAIQQVVMDSWGSGYSYATVSFADVNRDNTFNEFINASAYVTLPPANGHGFDAVKELFGRTVAISSSIKTDPLLSRYHQDYRQFGIISHPRNIISNKTSSIDFDFNAYQVTFNSTTNLVIDEVLKLNGELRYRVVFVDGTSVFLQPLHRSTVDPVGTFTAEVDSNRSYISSITLKKPVINKHTGSLLYISNEQPFEFSDTQSLQIKTYIRF